MRRLLQKQTRSLQTARVLAQAIRSDIPQSGLDPAYNQITPQIIIQQSGFEQPPPIAPSASSSIPVPGLKDPIAEELKRIDADVKHGLLDKTGDGANANIIKLGEELKKVAEGIKNISAGSGKITAREIQYDDERLSAIRMQAERYIPGMRETLGGGERGIFGGLKDIFSSSPMKNFKLEDIDERSLFGGVIKRRMAERQYAEDQLSMIKTTKGDIQEDIQKQTRYQDEQGQFSEKLFRQRKIEQFRQQNAIRGEISKTMEEIDRLKHDEGYTDEQIKKTGLYKTLHKQEARLSLVDPERFGKEVRAAKRKDYEQQLATHTGSIAPKNISSVSPTSPISDTLEKSSVNISEKESEQMLVVSQQIGLLKQIEENTRHLKDLGSILKSAMDKIGTAGGSDSGGGGGGGIDLGGLGDLGNGPDRRRGSRGHGIGSKLKQLGTGAIQLGAKGARAALPYALPAAIAYGAARTLDYGASALGAGDVEIDETEDEANWQKMSAGQKIGSGIARGIESVGSFLGLESFAKEAEASRIEKETKMLQGQTQSSSASEQPVKATPVKEPDEEKLKQIRESFQKSAGALAEAQAAEKRLTKEKGAPDIEWGRTYRYEIPDWQGKKTGLSSGTRDAYSDAVTDKEYEQLVLKQAVSSDKASSALQAYGQERDSIQKLSARDLTASERWPVSPAMKSNAEKMIEALEERGGAKSGEIQMPRTVAQYQELVSRYRQMNMVELQKNKSVLPQTADAKGPGLLSSIGSGIGDEGLVAAPGQEQTLGEIQAKTRAMVGYESIEPSRQTGSVVYDESNQLKQAESQNRDRQPEPSVINAPVTNINQTTNNVTRPPARNTDSTYREYSKSRFSW